LNSLGREIELCGKRPQLKSPKGYFGGRKGGGTRTYAMIRIFVVKREVVSKCQRKRRKEKKEESEGPPTYLL